VEGEVFQPIEIVPPVTVNLQESVYVFPDHAGKNITVHLRTAVHNARGIVRLKLPESWNSSPVTREFTLNKKGDEQTLSFSVQPSNGARSGKFTAEVEIGSTLVDCGIITARYKHIPPQTLLLKAEGKLLRIDLKKSGRTVGYIMGAGDEVPAAITQMGYSVALLSDDDLSEGNLDKYDILVAGVRAYNTRSKLWINQKRLMSYVERGGTYIVQYITPQQGGTENLGPYPFSVSRDRVTEEDAAVTFFDRNSPIVTMPNRITEDDFRGWIQERGLYFADHWDPRYDSVLTCHDRNEPPRSGGLLTAKSGKGTFVYCAYAFFRQLPAGVEGAYRLFANILSYRGSLGRSSGNKPVTTP
jgi:hypothetical protein